MNTKTKLKQVAGLFSVNLIGLPLSIVTSILLARHLGPKGFGDYKFIVAIFNLSVVLFSIGFFQAGNRALVLNKRISKAQEYYGAVLVILLYLFLTMSFCLLIYVGCDDNILTKGLRPLMLMSIPFGWIFLLKTYQEVLLPADNKMRLLIISRLFPQLGMFVVVIYLSVFNDQILTSLTFVWFLFLFVSAAVSVFVIIRLRVSFVNLKPNIGRIWNYNKSFGLHLYLGSVFAVALTQSSIPIISYFEDDNSGVGLYSLALALSTPLVFIPNTIATAYYKDFSLMTSVPRRLITITVGITVASLLVLLTIIGPFVEYFYGEEYLEVVTLVNIIGLGLVLQGLGDFFNRFLGANGNAKAIRNVSIVLGIVVFIGNFILIPKAGALGASYVHLFSGITYIVLILFFYKKHIFK